ncbi:pre-60S ribosomal particles component [Phytophthora boehmeriae]|uniref:Pre-60S ribosomal particles component n=1 Tax=Phytophthora boehmeriae TaxID=109152 RepID=A0A8T1VUZ4_9STRA|nr:pre-60S ribosomal particles component [Phytophthora boehmeriae]
MAEMATSTQASANALNTKDSIAISKDNSGSEQEANSEQEQSEEEDVEPQSDASDDEGEGHEAVGFGDAMSKILGQNVAEDAQPILAKRTTARMREIQSDKKETKTARLSAAEKREREQKDMAIPDHTTAVQDRKLRMIATKGVVALFNAIEKHQHQSGNKDDKNDKKVKEMSKDNFLGLLKAQQKATPAAAAKSSWSVVQDDFMMGAKLKDWDNTHGTEVGRVRQAGDVDTEAAEDVAWKQAAQDLDSDHEADTKSNKRRTSAANKKGNKKAKRS